MSDYLLRRLLYAFPILLGVNIITFFLFFVVNSPDDMARIHLGNKYVTTDAIEKWKGDRGYDRPLFYNSEKYGRDKLLDTIFYAKTVKLFVFDFGQSDSGRDIGYDISQRMWPSLMITLPILILGLFLTISLALAVAFFRATYLDTFAVIMCVCMMSISGLFYIIGGQYFFSKLLKIVPISGFDDGFLAIKFLILPIVVGVVGGLGNGTRWYRTIFLEEVNQDYVRTARSKGLSEKVVFYVHVLRNGMIPILTGVVALLPSLFLGSLITEAFFGIPGLGSYTIEAIQSQDFSIVRAMVFLGSALYILGLVLTDIAYTFVDPRISLR